MTLTREGAGERDRSADLPFTRWKQPLAQMQVEDINSVADLRGQVMDGCGRSPADGHGGTILDHEWDQMGPESRPSSQAVRTLEHAAEQVPTALDTLRPTCPAHHGLHGLRDKTVSQADRH